MSGEVRDQGVEEIITNWTDKWFWEMSDARLGQRLGEEGLRTLDGGASTIGDRWVPRGLFALRKGHAKTGTRVRGVPVRPFPCLLILWAQMVSTRKTRLSGELLVF
uniref:Ribonuclease H protein n=1 Tax=Steinernema glaseri TaxID=37863 RepID=A0A1I7ZJ68_9BILA